MGHIYWIASYPKSGNTWMRAFLTAIVTGADNVDLSLLGKVVPDQNIGYFYSPFMSKPLDKSSLQEFARVRPMAHRAMAAKARGFVLLKTHSMLVRHLGTPTITADVTAGAIYIVRNPLDVAVSYSEFRARSIDTTIKLMNSHGRVLPRPPLASYEVCGSWVEHVRSWTGKPHDRLLVLRYEDMLEQPEVSFRRVVDFLNMEVSDELLERALAATSFENLKAAEASGGFLERPPQSKEFFRAGRIGQWRELLSEAQVTLLLETCAADMRRFGYWEPQFDALLAEAPPGGRELAGGPEVGQP